MASAIVTDFNIPDEVLLTSIEVDAPGFEPSVTYKKLGDSSITFDVDFHVKKFVDQYTVKHEFIKRLHKRYMVSATMSWHLPVNQ